MRAIPRPGLTASLAALLALGLLPVVTTSTAPAEPAGHVTADVRVPDLSPVTWTMAGRTPQGPPLAQVAVTSSKGTRVWDESAMSDRGIPLAAERAYRAAAALLARTDPGCRLPWTLLAGIGRVESDHGRYGGARLSSDGVSRPRIIGVQLNGAGPVAAIRDTDDGRLDRDRLWDRAVGPMQFIPATWAAAARDGDGDGVRAPHDLDDAAAAAATYLCSGSGSLLDPTARAAAIYRYNQDDYYVALVEAFETGYRTGVFEMPSPPGDVDADRSKRLRRQARMAVATDSGRTAAPERWVRHRRPTPPPDPAPVRAQPPVPMASPKPVPTSTPQPSPKPSPSPTPAPPAEPAPETVHGELKQCDGGYCLDALVLDLGAMSDLDATAPADFNEVNGVETNRLELDGLLGQQVTMVVVRHADAPAGIHSINGTPVG